MNADLGLALRLADLADGISLPRFRALDLRVETKPDATPVTDADRAVERAARELLATERPAEPVLGEEEGGADESGGDRWIVDPIDGTRNFSRGVPVWATLIALERGGTLAAAVVSAPALGKRWSASRGDGAWCGGERLVVSAVLSLSDAAVSTTVPHDLVALAPHVWHSRGFGEFWQHVLVAEGALDAAVDSELARWDYAAVQLVVEEAGGCVTTLDGGPPRPGAQIVSSNGCLHDELLERLVRSRRTPS